MEGNLIAVRPFTSYFKRSLGIHLLLIFVTALWSLYLGKQWEKRRAYNLNLIKASVKVDVVAMPKMTFQELKELERLAGSKGGGDSFKDRDSGEKAQEGDFIKSGKPANFQEMMKKMARQKTKGELQRKGNGRELSEEARRKLKNLVLAGNKVSKGTNLTGSVSDEATKGLAIYMNSLPEKVRAHWKLPSFLQDMDLRCRIRIFLDPRGNLIRAEVIEESGEPEYDKRALEAIQATKFPPLDLAYQSEGSRGAIVLGFPL